MAATWARLVSEYRIVTTAGQQALAPWEMTGPQPPASPGLAYARPPLR